MAYNKTFKKAKSKNFKKKKSYKKYSFLDRMSYYENKLNNGKTRKEQDYAYGFLSGMRGIRDSRIDTDSGKAGNDAGLRFWHKLTKFKI